MPQVVSCLERNGTLLIEGDVVMMSARDFGVCGSFRSATEVVQAAVVRV